MAGESSSAIIGRPDRHVTPSGRCPQIKLLRLLAVVGAGDVPASENMYGVVGGALQRAALQGNTIGNAIVYEAARTITTVHPNADLLQSGHLPPPPPGPNPLRAPEWRARL